MSAHFRQNSKVKSGLREHLEAVLRLHLRLLRVVLQRHGLLLHVLEDVEDRPGLALVRLAEPKLRRGLGSKKGIQSISK